MSREKVFVEIYRKKKWGKNVPSSGEGTSPKSVGPYLKFLEDFLEREPEILSILDIGHGDWQMWPENYFKNYEYHGIDVVKQLSENLNLIYGNEKITFEAGDFLEIDLPNCDLLLIKDVLIHLSNSDIVRSLRILSKYKYVIVTSDTHSSGIRVFFAALVRVIRKRKWKYLINSIFSPNKLVQNEYNSDIETGEYHWVDLSQPNWNLSNFGLKLVSHTEYEISGITFGRRVRKVITLLRT